MDAQNTISLKPGIFCRWSNGKMRFIKLRSTEILYMFLLESIGVHFLLELIGSSTKHAGLWKTVVWASIGNSGFQWDHIQNDGWIQVHREYLPLDHLRNMRAWKELYFGGIYWKFWISAKTYTFLISVSERIRFYCGNS